MARDPQLTLTDVQWVLGPRAPDHDRALPDARPRTRWSPACWPTTPARPTGATTGAPAAGAGLRPAVAERAVREAVMTPPSSTCARKAAGRASPRSPPSAGAEQPAAGTVPATAGCRRGGRTPRDGGAGPAAADRAAVRRRRRRPPGPAGGAVSTKLLRWLSSLPGRHLAAALAGQRRRAASGQRRGCSCRWRWLREHGEAASYDADDLSVRVC